MWLLSLSTFRACIASHGALADRWSYINRLRELQNTPHSVFAAGAGQGSDIVMVDLEMRVPCDALCAMLCALRVGMVWCGVVWCGVVWGGVWGGVLSYQTITVCWMLSSVTVHLMSFLLFYMLYVSRSSHDVYPTVSLSLAIPLPTLPIPIPTSNFYPNPYVTIITPSRLSS